MPEFIPGLRPSPGEGAWGYAILSDGPSSVDTRQPGPGRIRGFSL